MCVPSKDQLKLSWSLNISSALKALAVLLWVWPPHTHTCVGASKTCSSPSIVLSPPHSLTHKEPFSQLSIQKVRNVISVLAAYSSDPSPALCLGPPSRQSSIERGKVSGEFIPLQVTSLSSNSPLHSACFGLLSESSGSCFLSFVQSF